jgi:hypothetical protein
MVRRRLLVLASAALLAPLPAVAQPGTFPGLTLTFLDPTGTVTPTETVEVWVRLALDAGAPFALTFDGTSPPDFGLPAGIVPAEGFRTNTSYTCTGTFWPGCSTTEYQFQFHTSNADPTRPSFNFLTSFALNPGESFDYLFGRFIPQGAGAAPGTYEFTRTSAFIQVFGTNAAGAELEATVDLASTCPAGGPPCSFSRTVVAVAAVPEPATVALLATGLAALGWVARRRRAA